MKTKIGCLMAIVLLAGCAKNPQTTGNQAGSGTSGGWLKNPTANTKQPYRDTGRL